MACRGRWVGWFLVLLALVAIPISASHATSFMDQLRDPDDARILQELEGEWEILEFGASGK